jgi:DNA (cytosine-5)-methyltransferase 1
MKILDLFCKAGGAGYGYYLAGFEVVGVDIEPQPHFPFEFHQADAIEYLREHWMEFDAIHASPPCQEYSKSAAQWRKEGREYPDLVGKTREELIKTGKPYIIENVPNSPLINPIMLNGSIFNLLVHRPRLFETNFPVEQPYIPKTKRPVKMGRPVKEGDIIQPVGHFSGVAYARKQMQIGWMNVGELAQAIPPAYTKYIGEILMGYLNVQYLGISGAVYGYIPSISF